MKRFFLFFLIGVSLFSCHSNKRSVDDTGKEVIIVSILPQKTFVEKIAGDDFSIQVLVPHGASPESYTLLPSQLKQISRAAIWFRIGYIGFEASWKDKVEQMNRGMQVVDLSEGLDLIVGETIHHGDHVHVDGVDPHVWLSPVRVKQMARQIAEVLIRRRPEKASEYRHNYQQFVQEIDRLDLNIREALHEYQGRSFITFHPSLSYFASDYGLNQYSLESGGKEPTPQHMAKVMEIARNENIGEIYIQSEFDREHARVFAEEIGGKVIEVRPLHPDWGENLMEMTNLFIENF